MYVKSLYKTFYNKFSKCHHIKSIQGLYIYIVEDPFGFEFHRNMSFYLRGKACAIS